MADSLASPNNGELAGKIALVTGASRGIGRAIALRLGRAGARVVLNYAGNAAKADEAVAAIEAGGGQAMAIQADISRRADVTRLFQQAEEHFGAPDIVVSNAGVYQSKPLADVTEADFDELFNLNARGVFFTLQEAARRVRDGGHIINISAGVTAFPSPNQSVYAGCKAAAEQFCFVLAKELGGRQITVNSVLPGPTETDALTLPEQVRGYLIQSTPLGRLGQPDDIAEVVNFLAGPASGWLTGQNVRATGGLV